MAIEYDEAGNVACHYAQQLKPLPILNLEVSEQIDEVISQCESLQESFPTAAEVNESGPFSPVLADMKYSLRMGLHNYRRNKVKSILRGYLFNLQPQTCYMKCRLPHIMVETKERRVKFDFEVRKGEHEYHKWAPESKGISDYVDKINAFNALVAKNTELEKFDPKLTGLQSVVIDHIGSYLTYEERHFKRDCELFQDLCAAYRGDIVILNEPQPFVPVKVTEVMRLLITPSVKALLENILECKVGGNGQWKIHLQKNECEACTKEKTSFRNLMVDANNPNKYILYRS